MVINLKSRHCYLKSYGLVTNARERVHKSFLDIFIYVRDFKRDRKNIVDVEHHMHFIKITH